MGKSPKYQSDQSQQNEGSDAKIWPMLWVRWCPQVFENYIWLVVEPYPLWKNMNSSVGDDDIPNMNGKNMFQNRLLAIINHRFTRKIHVPKPPSRYYITVFHTARDPWKWFRKKKTNMKCLTNTESWSGHIIPIFDPNLVVGWIHLPYINPIFPQWNIISPPCCLEYIISLYNGLNITNWWYKSHWQSTWPLNQLLNTIPTKIWLTTQYIYLSLCYIYIYSPLCPHCSPSIDC